MLGTTQGILTAGHCNPGSPSGTSGTAYWHAINGHWVQLPVPTIARVFSPADTGANVTAYGIATAADSYSDGSSVFVYSPIDYIDDEQPIRVVLNTD